MKNPTAPPVDGILHPTTGELVEPTLEAAAAAMLDLEAEQANLGRYRAYLMDFVARELDRRGGKRRLDVELVDGRTAEVEVNPPTSEEYLPDVLLDELKPLVKDGVLDEGYVSRELVYRPPPPTPKRRVARREVDKLKTSGDRRILAAIAKARTVVNNNRTAKVKPKGER